MQPRVEQAASDSPEETRADTSSTTENSVSTEPTSKQEEDRVELPEVGEILYCRRCQEPLSFFSTGPWHCWKCNLEFDPRRPRSYLRRRALLRWKFWFPGFCLSVACGMLGFGLLTQTRELVTPTIAAATLIVGSLLGYGAPLRLRLYVMLFVVLACMLLGALATGSLLGLIAGGATSVVLLVPVVLGLAAGVVLRQVLAQSNWDQRWYFP
ncbi:MAG: hypothetical protein RIC55_10450 [Pirellulaceae bacterium]